MHHTAHPTSIDQAWPPDRPRLQRLRKALRRGGAEARTGKRKRFDEQLAASAQLYASRRAAVPAVPFEGDLPVLARREEIAEAIARNPVVVVCGETGSGKSTQLPKLCLAAGRGVGGVIGHTQPRRIAARSVAARIAAELSQPLGEAVGCKVRFHDQTGPGTYIKLMTDGVLLAEAQGDPLLRQYDTLIIDEAHERSLNIDLLLGLLHGVIRLRPGLRVVITSATIDAQRFAEFFASAGVVAPVIEVTGRTFPVELRYDPPDTAGQGTDTPREAADAVERLLRETTGDTLVFLPTERDIREAARLLRGRLRGGAAVDIAPLYARLSAKEQQRALSPGKRRRVVLATNVAESSLTVPGVRAVVDTGTARIARFAARSRVQRLPVEAISQASADQRAGRCGRVGPGVCVRLYSQADYDRRPPFTAPEIRRTNLAGAMLRLRVLGLGELADLPLLDRPRPDALREARKTLLEIQAIDADGSVTPLGQKIGRMPVDPRIGRMIVAAGHENCVAEVLVIAAALETQDPRERPADKREAADRAHARDADGRSDFIGLLNLWRRLRALRGELSRNRFKRACAEQFLSVSRVLEWEDVHRQLLLLAEREGLRPNRREASFGAVHRAVLAGLLSGVAMRRGDEGYQSASGEGFELWPGSALVSQAGAPHAGGGGPPKWIVAAETVETGKRYLRTAARVRPEWLPRLAAHLVDKRHEGPYYSLRRQVVQAWEKLSLFGMPLAGRRAVDYGPINPRAARAVFIREALIDEGLQGEWEFLTHNRSAIERLRRLDAKLRPATPLVDDATLFDFYDERLPSEVCDLKSFRQWRRRAERDGAPPLTIDRGAMDPLAPDPEAEGFPDFLESEGGPLPIEYRRGGGPRDSDAGPTLVAPMALAGALDADVVEWGLPGNLRDRVVAVIRALPKPLRTRLVPAPDVAQRVAAGLPFGRGGFRQTLAAALSEAAGTPIDPSDIALDRVPAPLRLRVRIEDGNGERLAEGFDLHALRRHLGIGAADTRSLIDDPAWPGTPAVEWSFGPLAHDVEITRGAHRFRAYPGLIDHGDAAAARLFASPCEAEASTARGVARLVAIRLGEDLATHVQWLPEWPDLAGRLSRWRPNRRFDREAGELLAARALEGVGGAPRDAEAFERTVAAVRQRLPLAAQEVARPLTRTLRALADAEQALATPRVPRPRAAADDIRGQLDRLCPGGFLSATPWGRLEHLPRYLHAVAERLRRIDEGAAAKDARMQARVAPHVERLAEAEASGDGRWDAEQLAVYRWMIEEYRVSVFAQRLGTAGKVSEKRLDEQWARCRRA